MHVLRQVLLQYGWVLSLFEFLFTYYLWEVGGKKEIFEYFFFLFLFFCNHAISVSFQGSFRSALKHGLQYFSIEGEFFAFKIPKKLTVKYFNQE